MVRDSLRVLVEWANTPSNVRTARTKAIEEAHESQENNSVRTKVNDERKQE